MLASRETEAVFSGRCSVGRTQSSTELRFYSTTQLVDTIVNQQHATSALDPDLQSRSAVEIAECTTYLVRGRPIEVLMTGIDAFATGQSVAPVMVRGRTPSRRMRRQSAKNSAESGINSAKMFGITGVILPGAIGRQYLS
jgi:hypothetical protein